MHFKTAVQWSLRWIGARLGRSNAVWIAAIAGVSIAAAFFSFTQAAHGLQRSVALSDARKTARLTLVALRDQESALRSYASFSGSRPHILNMYRHAEISERGLHAPLRGYVEGQDDARASAAFVAFEVASKHINDQVKRSVLGQHRSQVPAAVFDDINAGRRSLNALSAEFNLAGKRTVAATKIRILLAGFVWIAATILFGTAALLMERMRRRKELQHRSELLDSLVERRRANVPRTPEIAKREPVEHRPAFAALHDELTGLANRAFFMDYMDKFGAETYPRDHRWAVLVLDLDRFKAVNESLGHSAGDLLLIAIARRLEVCLRFGDTLTRLGGDEFTILLDDIDDASAACTLAERVLREFDSAFTIAERDVFMSASIGIAIGKNGEDRPNDVLRNADTAMHHAKAHGKQCYELFRPELLAVALEVEVEADLACARARSVSFAIPADHLATRQPADKI